VDPFFSSGVHIAFTGALSAALTICASIKGQTPENIAQEWHDIKLGVSHTRFLFVVLGAYQQMHLQSTPILNSDLNTQNFDHAFELFRPVIYGLADSAQEPESKEVQHMMDTFQALFDPLVAEGKVAEIRELYGKEVTSIDGPVLGRKRIQEMAKDDSEAERVLRKYDGSMFSTRISRPNRWP